MADDSSSQSHVCTINIALCSPKQKGNKKEKEMSKGTKYMSSRMNTHGSTNPCRPNLFEEANKKYTINYQHFGISEVSQNGLGRRDRVGGLWVQSRGWENVTPALPLSSWALAMGRQFLTELACLHLQASHHLPLW